MESYLVVNTLGLFETEPRERSDLWIFRLHFEMNYTQMPVSFEAHINLILVRGLRKAHPHFITAVSTS